MRKYFCHSHFNLRWKLVFTKCSISTSFFIMFSIMFYLLLVNFMFYSVFHPWDWRIVPLLLSCFLIRVTFELFATDSYVVCTKVKFALERDISLPRWHCRINDHWYTPNVTFELRENEGFHLRYYTHPSSFVS